MLSSRLIMMRVSSTCVRRISKRRKKQMDHRPHPEHFRAWLDAAIEQAEKSWREGGIPIGSVLVDPEGNDGRGLVVSAGHNMRVQSGDPTAHAEVVCIRNAGRRRDWNRLTLVSTLSPCPMCSGTSILFKIPRVIVGESQNFYGGEDLLRENGVEVVCLNDAECIEMMGDFIANNSDLWHEDIGLE